MVLPGDAKTGVKDPVIRLNGTWQMWACCHPLADPADADQMVTDYATSSDGVDWTWHGTALSGRPGSLGLAGHPDQRGLAGRRSVVAFYDGRASAAENYEERTGIAAGTEPSPLTALGADPAAESPHAGRGLRYLDILELPGGGHRTLLRDDPPGRRPRAAHRAALAARQAPLRACDCPAGLAPTSPPERSLGCSQSPK